jgi:hypothetical protein
VDVVVFVAVGEAAAAAQKTVMVDSHAIREFALIPAPPTRPMIVLPTQGLWFLGNALVEKEGS